MVTTDDEFASYQSVDPTLVEAHAKGQTLPNKKDLHFDMTKGPDSLWNGAVIEIIVKRMEKARKRQHLPPRTHEYFIDLASDKYNRIRAVWRHTQPKLNNDGMQETPEEVENHLSSNKDDQWSKAREGNGR
jgi:hypothetical protein